MDRILLKHLDQIEEDFLFAFFAWDEPLSVEHPGAHFTLMQAFRVEECTSVYNWGTWGGSWQSQSHTAGKW